jgi:para-aminobenzoate synthetase component 1
MKQEYIDYINELGQRNVPFLFVINYYGDEAIIKPLDKINDTEIRYDFNGITNCYSTEHFDCNSMKWIVDMPTKECYAKGFHIIEKNIMAGNSYLANYTCSVPVKTNMSLSEIFNISKAKYRLEIKDKFVCFSPESFIKINNGKIYSFPMKGTADATVTDAENTLLSDMKESAEHATIVDLIRNDISKVATDVKVDRYRYIDYISNNTGKIIQTSSQISGLLPDDYKQHIGDIIASQLPAGSITGAPKKKTVEIIAEAENYERGYYTGTMGIYSNGNIDSAVMIRFIEKKENGYVFKAGGGITSKSECDKEYNEIKQKIYVPIY